MFPKPRDRISSVLLNSPLGGELLHHVSCHISCQVLEYLEPECRQGTDIEDIFTITGELDRAYGARLGDYLREMWATGASFSKALRLALAGVTEDQGGKQMLIPERFTMSLVLCTASCSAYGASHVGLGMLSFGSCRAKRSCSCAFHGVILD